MNTPPSKDKQTHSSEWGKLSQHLISTFYEVQKEAKKGADGKEVTTWTPVPNGPEVRAPLTEAAMSMALNWQSPFENAGAEAKAPALMAMLQSGAMLPIVNDILGVKTPKVLQDAADSMKRASQEFFARAQGRTGITKLNSTQIFTGMQPVKFQVTALFRAWRDPVTEVQQPVDQLMRWALPVELSADGTILSRAVGSALGDRTWMDALLPSRAPVMIAMRYKGATYFPLVIEAVEYPLGSPIDNEGQFVELAIPMTICSLTAIDRTDWDGFRTVQL